MGLNAMIYVMFALMAADDPAAASTAACLNDAAYLQAKSAIAEVDVARARGDWPRSITLADAAIKTLGYGYASQLLIDDTGQHLALAEIQTRDGNLTVASNIKRSVLEARVMQFEFRCSHPAKP